LDLRKRKETQLSEGRIDSPPTYLKVKTALQLHRKVWKNFRKTASNEKLAKFLDLL
jgi:hypothetical protein